MKDDRGELWDAAVQGRDPADVEARRERASPEWERAWELPVPFHALASRTQGSVPARCRRSTRSPASTSRCCAPTRPPTRRSAPTGSSGSRTRSGSARRPAPPGRRRSSSSGRTTSRFTARSACATCGATACAPATGSRTAGRRGSTRPTSRRPLVPHRRRAGDLGRPAVQRRIAAEHLRLWKILRPTAFMMTGAQLRTYEEAAAATASTSPAMIDGAILVLPRGELPVRGPATRVEKAYGVRLRNSRRGVGDARVRDDRLQVPPRSPRRRRPLRRSRPATRRPAGRCPTASAARWWCRRSASTPTSSATTCRTSSRCRRGGASAARPARGTRSSAAGADAVSIGDRTVLPLDMQLALEPLGSPEFQLAPQTDERNAPCPRSSTAGPAPHWRLR